MVYYDVIELEGSVLFVRIQKGRYVSVLYRANEVLHDKESDHWELASGAKTLHSSDRMIRQRETIMMMKSYFSLQILDDLDCASAFIKPKR